MSGPRPAAGFSAFRVTGSSVAGGADGDGGSWLRCPRGHDVWIAMVLDGATFVGFAQNMLVRCPECGEDFDGAPGGDGMYSTGHDGLISRIGSIRDRLEAGGFTDAATLADEIEAAGPIFVPLAAWVRANAGRLSLRAVAAIANAILGAVVALMLSGQGATKADIEELLREAQSQEEQSPPVSPQEPMESTGRERTTAPGEPRGEGPGGARARQREAAEDAEADRD